MRRNVISEIQMTTIKIEETSPSFLFGELKSPSSGEERVRGKLGSPYYTRELYLYSIYIHINIALGTYKGGGEFPPNPHLGDCLLYLLWGLYKWLPKRIVVNAINNL